jgi:hypothetical protein
MDESGNLDTSQDEYKKIPENEAHNIASQSSLLQNGEPANVLAFAGPNGLTNELPFVSVANQMPAASLGASSSSFVLPSAQHLMPNNPATNQPLSLSGHAANSLRPMPTLAQIIMARSHLSGVFSSIPQFSTTQTNPLAWTMPAHLSPVDNGASSASASALQTLATMASSPASPSLPSPFRCMTLYLEQDEDSLSPYQCLVRKQIELFEATEKDLEDSAQGRNRSICPRQVGIRCRHCGRQPAKNRAKGAVFFPSRLVGLYQTAQNLANSHLVKDCKVIPTDIREDLLRIRLSNTTKETTTDGGVDTNNKLRKSSHGSGRQYWASCLRVLGVIETPDQRLCFAFANGFQRWLSDQNL